MAAAYFTSFWKGNMMKRLLRYTVTKLDFFEDDSIDLDDIDLVWGQAGHFTWQNIDLKIKKIEQILQLPPSIQITKARALVVRISAPDSISSGPITTEVDGIVINIRVIPPEEQKASKNVKTRHRANTAEQPLGDAVPHAIDLAQSFLETQPRKEKEELQAALNAEVHDLTASVASSEDGSDEESPLGTGQSLPLPTFFAGMLQNLVDRLQVKVKGVTCHLDVDVPVEPNSPANKKVTFQLALDGVDVYGVPRTKVDEQGLDPAAKILKEGKRYIELHKIRASLISEANVFSMLSRTPSMPASGGASSPVAKSYRSLSREPTSVHHSVSSLDGYMAQSAELGESQYHPLMDSEDAFNIPYDLGSSNDDPEEDEARSAPSTPRALTPRHTIRDTLSAPSQSAFTMQSEPWLEGEQSTAKSEPLLGPPRLSGQSSPLPDPPAVGEHESTPWPSGSQDLAESHIYSHEEAESMYMSAFSHADSVQMPGAWGADFAGNRSPPKQKRKLPKSQNDPSPMASIQSLPPAAPLEPTAEEDTIAESIYEAVEEPHQPPLGAEPRSPVSESSPTDNPVRETFMEEEVAEENVAEGVATPKGPTRLAKELVTSEAMKIWVPEPPSFSMPTTASGQSDVTTAAHGSLNRSVLPIVPGAFSVHGDAQSVAAVTESLHQAPSGVNKNDTVDNTVEVIMSPLELKFDLPTVFLLTNVLSRILTALKDTSTPQKTSKPTSSTKPPSPPIDLKVIIEALSINFLETLSGVADSPERALGERPVGFGDADALLKASLQDLQVEVKNNSERLSTTTSVQVGKLNLGYANDDIISFDQRLQMQASIRDAFPPKGADVSLKMVQLPKSTKCEVTTLPLHVKLDLPRLDETFTWFGGLSGFINMSSSMTSNTPTIAQTESKPPQKPRGVRFDAPIRADDGSATSENKANARIGGFYLDLVGRDCSVLLATSAVKLVTREEGVGIGISKIQLCGPYTRHSSRDPPINVVVTNTRLEFLSAPKDNDLERLLELIIPSKNKFSKADDEIMVDTLLRQRRKGSVLRVNVAEVDVSIAKIQILEILPSLGEDIARLSTVAKYLPEDNRPGLLTLTLVRSINVTADIDKKIGIFQGSFKELEVGHITLPSLVAVALGSISVQRNHNEQLVSTVRPAHGNMVIGPAMTMRMIGDEMEPVIKLRMQHMDIEYRVPTIMDLLGLGADTTPQEFEASLAASVADLGERAHTALAGKAKAPAPETTKGNESKPTRVDIAFSDCLLGLNPLGLMSKIVVVLTDARFEVSLANGDDANVKGNFNKASILLIDDVSVLESSSPSTSKRRPSNTATPQIVELCERGFVDICYISSAKVVVQIGADPETNAKWVDVELRDDLLVLETCADSTQTLITLANALAPPTPPKREVKYRTKIVPVQDMLASISADAFGKAEGAYDFDDDFLAQGLGAGDDSLSFDLEGSDHSSPLAVDSQYYHDPSADEQLVDPANSILSERTASQETNDGVLLTNFNSQPEVPDDDDELVIHDNYFTSGSVVEGTAHRWNSTNNEYDQSNNSKLEKSPLSVRVRDVHFIWNLFDGYDWNHTRDTISKAVHDIEMTAMERQSRQDRTRAGTDMEVVDEETVIGDFLFNSIYIGIPANRDPRELALAINQELNDNATETESIATTAMTAATNRHSGSYRNKKRLRLNRSKRHKITFELKGINVDFLAFPPDSGETQSSIDVRVKDLDVFDHVPTSTWKKFATYDQDAGEREMDASMAHLEILNVKPLPDLAASEIVLKVSILPLRLHVDQDALDFITRFFEFKDDSQPPTHASPSDVPFIQRAEINSIPVTLDFKPKRVDYAGLRSGHTTEFMNFLVLDQSRMVLRRTIVYGASGFDRLGKTLNDTWSPDVKRNQLPGVLAGLAPVRSLVNVGSGFKDLIEIPIKEYKKDGRIVRSIGKGAAAFAKTTSTEIVKLGAKLAVGTQYALQGAEGMLVKPQSSRQTGGWEEDEEESEETKQISLYADQPTGVVQGLRGAYSSLARDLNLARDAIIAVPGEVMESENAQGAAKAVLKRAPTIIFRPLIGSSKAIGQTLMGATNTLDPQNRRRIDEKYKKH
ncbi:hypothetical protein F5Y16DRAFT_244387 [Xylariaceae sp. FL0255]|nr:hypothetical protein F5Y16DRAFT_244387 [Xylariaceae sp. FL0255]